MAPPFVPWRDGCYRCILYGLGHAKIALVSSHWVVNLFSFVKGTLYKLHYPIVNQCLGIVNHYHPPNNHLMRPCFLGGWHLGDALRFPNIGTKITEERTSLETVAVACACTACLIRGKCDLEVFREKTPIRIVI